MQDNNGDRNTRYLATTLSANIRYEWWRVAFGRSRRAHTQCASSTISGVGGEPIKIGILDRYPSPIRRLRSTIFYARGERRGGSLQQARWGIGRPVTIIEADDASALMPRSRRRRNSCGTIVSMSRWGHSALKLRPCVGVREEGEQVVPWMRARICLRVDRAACNSHLRVYAQCVHAGAGRSRSW